MTGENTDELLSSENTKFREPSPWAGDEGNVVGFKKSSAVFRVIFSDETIDYYYLITGLWEDIV